MFVLEDRSVFERYLGELRMGSGRHRAARSLGVSASAVSAWIKSAGRESEAAEAQEAEEEALEKVEDVLFEAALAGEPWAVDKWLKHRAPEKWSERALAAGGQLALGSGSDLAGEVQRMALALALREGVEVGRSLGAIEARKESAIDTTSSEQT